MDWLHFLNLQYWYCIFYSLFGGRCAYLDQLRAEQEAARVDGPSALEAFINFFVSGTQAVWEFSSAFLTALWNAFSAFAWSVSGFLFFSILSTLGMLIFIRLREASLYSTLPPRTEEDIKMRDRWSELLERALSSDPKEWKEAVLGADRMLGELLDLLGFKGATTPDKMRMLPEDAFQTVPQAWEAHRIRNYISSGASDYILTQREAYRVMKLYEQVFEEQQFI